MRGKALVIILALIGIGGYSFAQQGTNKAKLRELSQRLEQRHNERRAEALQFAASRGIPVQQTLPDGTFIELQFIENGRPVYYETQNINAAATTRADELWSGGSLGLSLDGSGFSGLGLWDGGAVRTTHQEFTNNGSSRAIQQESNPMTVSDHATHVAGTLIAAGVVSGAKGMAYNSTLMAWDWDNDESEIAAAANNGLEISNHSYGFIHGWEGSVWYGDKKISREEDYWFGFYSSYTQQLDEIAYNAPYYLYVKSAGNDRDDVGTGTYPPDGGIDGYDCIGTRASAKNILTVGAVNDVLNYTGAGSVLMSDFSSWGPVDDGRIKPDIVANGVGLYSSLSGSDSNYGSYSGTSMSSPNAAGTMALLKEHYMNTHGGERMRAATLKALVIHTADECGPDPGPDYMFGWGLMNAERAAQKITEDNDADWNVIDELVLANGQTYTREITVDGTEPLWVTICWTDPAGTPVAAQLDPLDPMLVNDLDLRIVGNSQTYFPYRLQRDNPTAAAVNDAENNVDNVEMVYIAAPAAGTYTIQVDHDGNIGQGQYYSMIISGMGSSVPPEPPVADFAGSPTTVEEGQSVQFTDLSTNNPTSWSWDFPGGSPSSSTVSNPIVTYNTAGSYDVTLTVTNSAGPNSKTEPAYITVTPFVAQYCIPSVLNATAEWIESVDIDGQINTSGQSSGFDDQTGFTFNLPAGGTSSIIITPGFNPRNKFEYYAIWIDFNEDRDFEDSGELVFTASKKRSTAEGTFNIPSEYEGVPTNGLTTRMRIVMSRNGDPTDPCATVDNGEVEDYTVVIGEGAPEELLADFEGTPTVITVGDQVTFTDLSTGDPDTWNWDLPGGTPSTSTDQNPVVTYNSIGTYSVSLTVWKGTDNNSINKAGYIIVNDPATGYCASEGLDVSQEWIASVIIGGGIIDNHSGNEKGGYSDFTGISGDLSEGQTYTISVTPEFSGKSQREFFRVWIDFDGDFIFEADELVLSVDNKKSEVSGSFTVPQVSNKSTRMRVSMRAEAVPPACDPFDRGEVEDYTVNLVNGTIIDGGKSGRILADQPESLLVYPNPGDRLLNIDYNGDLENASLRIYNVQGSAIIDQKVISDKTILDISGLTPGVYYIALNTGQDIIYRKLVKR
jgi:PKD repeat protein